ncbi:MAG: hypothetical protein R2822_09275 [Spirosomataceae bacterium]
MKFRSTIWGFIMSTLLWVIACKDKAEIIPSPTITSLIVPLLPYRPLLPVVLLTRLRPLCLTLVEMV